MRYDIANNMNIPNYLSLCKKPRTYNNENILIDIIELHLPQVPYAQSPFQLYYYMLHTLRYNGW